MSVGRTLQNCEGGQRKSFAVHVGISVPVNWLVGPPAAVFRPAIEIALIQSYSVPVQAARSPQPDSVLILSLTGPCTSQEFRKGHSTILCV